jgi:hypothetical protein
VTNSLFICVRKSLFLLFWRIIHRIQNSRLVRFSFNILNIWLHSLLNCMVSEGKLNAILIFASLCGIFPLWLLSRFFSLSLIFFFSLSTTYLHVGFWFLVFILLDVLWASCICGLVLALILVNFGQMFGHYCFKCYFVSLIFCLSSGIPVSWTLFLK